MKCKLFWLVLLSGAIMATAAADGRINRRSPAVAAPPSAIANTDNLPSAPVTAPWSIAARGHKKTANNEIPGWPAIKSKSSFKPVPPTHINQSPGNERQLRPTKRSSAPDNNIPPSAEPTSPAAALPPTDDPPSAVDETPIAIPWSVAARRGPVIKPNPTSQHASPFRAPKRLPASPKVPKAPSLPDGSITFPIESSFKNTRYGNDACFVAINTRDRTTELGEDPQPLYLRPNGELVESTDVFGGFNVERGSSITIYCATGLGGNRRGDRVVATCGAKKKFNENGQIFDISSVSCKQTMLGSTRRVANRQNACLKGRGEMAEVGFQVDAKWQPLFEVCFNPLTASSEWAHYIIDPTSLGFQKNFPRPRFALGDPTLYAGITSGVPPRSKVNVEMYYTKNKQQETFARILPGGMATVRKMIVGDRYLARGHLAAKADFIFGAHQLTTFVFPNVAPQWQTFNAGNWEAVEAELKQYIKSLDHRAEVYTGTHGVMKYEGVELYLYIDGSSKKLPVPKIFYKIVLVKSLMRAIVIIGVNNPFVSEADLRSEYDYCKDIKGPVDLLRGTDRYNKAKGYMMACTLQDFLCNKRIRDKNEHPYIENWGKYGLL